MSKPRSVLLIHLGGLGDAVMATPALRLLREALPGWRIGVLAKGHTAGFFKRLPTVDGVWSVDLHGEWSRLAPWRLPLVIGHLLHTLRELREQHFETALVWRDHGGDVLLGRLSGTQEQVVLVHDYLKNAGIRAITTAGAGTRILRNVPSGLHLSEVITLLVQRWLGKSDRELAFTEGRLEFPVTADEVRRAEAFLVANGLEKGRYAVLSVSSRTPYNAWPAERFVEVARGLAELGLHVVVDGLPEEKAVEVRITEACGDRAVGAIGKLGEGEIAEVIAGAAMLVAYNSAPIHMAAAKGVPVVVLNGRDGFAMSPWKTSHRIVTHNAFYPARHPDERVWRDLILQIRPDEVLSAAKDLLKETTHHG